ncbi:MAG: hypothetical protein MN733_07835, partial [Nitrososphaera sp.]|nr:hypothetical protein [Nitrososphaera sp.]
VKHVPAILASEIQEFPQCVAYIRQETAAGRMEPQIHGYQHVDYGKLHENEIARHLAYCIKFHEDNFAVRPTRFFTPWGAMSPNIEKACAVLDLEMVGTDTMHKLGGKRGAYQAIKDGRDLHTEWNGKHIIIHWWENTDRLQLVMEMLR